MNQEAESVMEGVSANEHKGNYGNTKGKSPNSLYKSYKTYMEDKGKEPMSFPKWMEWAQKTGVVKGNYGADAVASENKEKDEVAPPVRGNIRKYASVIIVGVSALLLYAAWKSENKGK